MTERCPGTQRAGMSGARMCLTAGSSGLPHRPRNDAPVSYSATCIVNEYLYVSLFGFAQQFALQRLQRAARDVSSAAQSIDAAHGVA